VRIHLKAVLGVLTATMIAQPIEAISASTGSATVKVSTAKGLIESDFTLRPDADEVLARTQSVAINPIVEPSGTAIRTYRMALATSGGYSAYFFGAATTDAEKKANVMVELNRAVTRLNQIYTVELGVRFELIPNNSDLIFLDPATDNYVDNNNSTDNDRNQVVVDSVIGSANYDIGHVFTKDSGGNAILGGVGDSRYKANGATGATSASSATGDGFWVELVAHEIGHMFGANHTMGVNTGSCSNTAPTAAVEPGSGSTIMSYAGLCGSTDDLMSTSEDYFHAGSLGEMRRYMATVPNAGTLAPAANAIPNVQVAPSVASFAIPPQTPFVLTATGSDADNNPLTYSWEQMDTVASTSQLISLNVEPKLAGPLMRSRYPSASPSRYFPAMSLTMAGTSNQDSGSCAALATAALKLACRIEFLPTTARTMDFRATVRDGQGGVRSTAVNVVVTGSTPFAITSHNMAMAAEAGTTQTITWNTAGTESWSPALSTVDISMSDDGGNTWTLMLNGTANDGSADVQLPSTPTSGIRFKVQPVNAIFFDVSNASVATYPVGATVPGAPTGVTGLATSGQVTVSWTAPQSDGGSTITNYVVTTSPGGFTCSGSSTSCVVTSLTNGTTYTFTVRATNLVGDGTPSASSSGVMPVGVALAPATITPTIGNGQVTVSWTAPSSDGGATITGYKVQRKTNAGTTWTTMSSSTMVNPYTFTGLSNGTAYVFRVAAVNNQGLGAYAITSAVTPATVPGVPTSVTAIPTDAQAAVSWTAPTSDGGSTITSYTVTASPGGQMCTTSALSCDLLNLTNGTSYTFAVTATNAVGTGSLSASSTAVTPTMGATTTTISPTTTTIALTSQSITFNSLADRIYGVAPFAVSATATSGLTVTVASSTSSVCTVAAGSVTVIKVGTCTLVAQQPGDSTFAAATDVTQQFVIAAKAVSVTASAITVSAGEAVTPSFTNTALVGNDAISSLTYTFAGTGATTYSVSTIKPTAVGTYSITPSAVVLSVGLITNYSFSYSGQTLTINALPTTTSAPSITFAPISTTTSTTTTAVPPVPGTAAVVTVTTATVTITTTTIVKTITKAPVTASAVAKIAKIVVPVGAKVAVTVAVSQTKVCKVTNGKLVATGNGTCTVTVAVSVKGKTTKKIVQVKAKR
jgi:hypothetical protein